MSAPVKRSGYVLPELTSRRVDAQWERVACALPSPKARSQAPRGIAIAFALTCVLGGAGFWRLFHRPHESSWAGSLVASDDAPMSFTLAEGTQIDVDPHSELELLQSGPGAVHMALSHGSARFDVAKHRARDFRVQVGPVQVVVTGTQFRVARRASEDGERVRVTVEEGTVEVHRNDGQIVRLTAGEQWTGTVPSDGPERVVVDGDATSAQVENEASADDDAETAAQESGRKARRKARESSAADLFDQANVLRRAGQLNEAAGLYADLVEAHPKDKRAALSAFELGRLRMDSLGDTRGAVDALERALKLDARRSFAEDALARLVLAHEALHERQACLRARERYFARYPEGVHAAHLAGRCTNVD